VGILGLCGISYFTFKITNIISGQVIFALIPLLKKGAEALMNELGTKLGDSVADTTVGRLKVLLNRITAKFRR
jgi:hypothetical protein